MGWFSDQVVEAKKSTWTLDFFSNPKSFHEIEINCHAEVTPTKEFSKAEIIFYLSKWWSLCPWRLSTGRNHGGNLGLQFWHLVFINEERLSRSKADL